LFAHDELDPGGHEDLGWETTLNLSGLRFDEVEVTEYRLDREHGIRDAYEALPKRGGGGVYTREELADLLAADELEPLGPPVRYEVTDGRLTLNTFVQGQGITFLEVFEIDEDGDGIWPEEDNCPSTPNPDQADADADGAGDVCDCAPDDPEAFSVPGESSGVMVRDTDPTRIDWDDQAPAAGSGTVYDVVTGSLTDLLRDAGYGAASCLESGLTDPTTTDGRTPVPSDGFYHLVRGRNACGAGTYGPDRDELDAASPCP
jgi:hypothetical protein